MLEVRFLDAVRQSYANYLAHGARSTEKLRPLHQWVADEMKILLGEEYSIQSLRTEGESGEATVSGKYYDKMVDVAISKDDMLLGIISVKFITSNFKQNANNYFEHLMGETANLRRNNIVFGHFMVIPHILPYFNKDGTIKKHETIDAKHLMKYVRLAQDEDYPHRPDALGIVVISLPQTDPIDASKIELQNVVEISANQDVDEADDNAVKNALSDEFSITSFMHRMGQLIGEPR